MAQALAVEGVQEGVSCTVCDSGTTICLASFAVFKGLSTKCTLIYFALICSTKGHAEMFQFDDCAGSFPAHVMNGILVAKPITPLDRIVHMPAPIIFSHISRFVNRGMVWLGLPESGVDSALGGDCMRTSWEEFCDAGCVESCFCKTKCST